MNEYGAQDEGPAGRERERERETRTEKAKDK